MSSVNDYCWGDWVLCQGQVMFVENSGDEDPNGKLGLSDNVSPELQYYPVEAVTPFHETVVSEETLRAFFRLNVTPWQLCAEGKYPFAGASGTFTLTEEDLLAFSRKLEKTDERVMDAWVTQFACVSHMTHVYCEETDLCGFSLAFAWEMICSRLDWFDIEEDDPAIITEIIQAYFESKGRALDQLNLTDGIKSDLIVRIERYAKDFTVNEMQRRAYTKYLNDLCAKGDGWAIETKAYAYYGGNRIVPCSWEISEEMLLKLCRSGNLGAANSLGYIYYSDRLGKPDYDKAFYYFNIAAKAGIIEAKYKLSDMYRKGHGTAPDYGKAWALLQELLPEELEDIQKQNYACHYADVILRIGYCYEDGIGVEQNIRKAHECYERARFAIEMRILHNNHFGDETVRMNIRRALLRAKTKDSTPEIIIRDLPGWPGDAYQGLSIDKKTDLWKSICWLFQCEFYADDFDLDGHEEHLDRALELNKEYDAEEIYNASTAWAKEQCCTPESFINFANLFVYYGFYDVCIANPYPFLAFLYNGIDWENDSVNAGNASDIFWSLATELLRKSGLISNYYYDEYEPMKDSCLLDEMKRQKKNTLDFSKVNMTGRLCYLFMCIERYLTSRWPDRDWTPVAECLWQWTKQSWDISQEISDQIIPEYILLKDNFEDTNAEYFDGELSEDLYNSLVSLYSGITSEDPEDELNQVLFLTVEWGTACDGASFKDADLTTKGYIDWMLSILKKYGIDVPDVCMVEEFTLDQRNGWGYFFDSRHLSIILNKETST